MKLARKAAVGAALTIIASITPLVVGVGGAHAAADCRDKPTNVASEINTEGTGIVVTWQAPASCEPDTYAIYRKIVGAGPGTTRIADVDGSTFEYTDGNVVAGTTYRYRIRSNDIGPKSAKTAPTMAEPPAPVRAPAPPPPPPPEEPPAPPPPPTIEYVPEPEPEIAEQHDEDWSCGPGGNSDITWVHNNSGNTVCQKGHDNHLNDNVWKRTEPNADKVDPYWSQAQKDLWEDNKTHNCAKNAYWTGVHCAFYLQTFNYDARDSREFTEDVNGDEHYVDFSQITSPYDLCQKDTDCTVRYCRYVRDTGTTKAPVCSGGSTFRTAKWVADNGGTDQLKHVSWL